MVLFLVAAVATGVLAFTYKITAPEIAAGEQQEKANALATIFFNGYKKVESKTIELDGVTIEYYEVFLQDNEKTPAYYALSGRGLGYNKSAPIELLVGFSRASSAEGKNNLICYGWKVIKSQETPGLGENAKQQKAAFTWWELLSGQRPAPTADMRTDFQKQFAGKTPTEMVVKKNIDIITGATYSTDGIVEAIKNAGATLQKILEPEK